MPTPKQNQVLADRCDVVAKAISEALSRLSEKRKEEIMRAILNHGDSVLSLGFRVSIKDVGGNLKLGSKLSFSAEKIMEEFTATVDLNQLAFEFDEDQEAKPPAISAVQ